MSDNVMEIKKKEPFYEKKFVVGISVMSSILSIPLSFLLSGKVTLAAIIAFIISLFVITMNLFTLIDSTYNIFENIKKEIDSKKQNYVCQHNCKEGIEISVNKVKKEIYSEICELKKTIGIINDKVEKTPESFDIINISDGKFLLIINDYSMKAYSVCIEGKHISDIELEPIMYASKSTSHQITINENISKSNVIKKLFDLETKVGVNHSFFKLKKNCEIDSCEIMIIITHNGRQILEPLSIKL